MTVTRVPATPKPTDKPSTHWIIGDIHDRHNACGAPSGMSPGNTSPNMTTCAACLDTVVRTLCLTPTPGDIVGVEVMCRQKVGADGTHPGLHDWERVLSSPLTDQERDRVLALDSPSGLLPVRVPGAALGDAVVHLGPGDLDEDGRPAESILGRPVIARWPA